MGWLAGMGPVGHGAGTTGQIPLEHTADGVGAAVDQLGDWEAPWPWAFSRTIW